MSSAWVIQPVCGGTSPHWKCGAWRRRDYCAQDSASLKLRAKSARIDNRSAAGPANWKTRGYADCAKPSAPAVHPSSVRRNYAISHAHSSAGPRASASPAGYGARSECASSSSSAPACDTTKTTCGASCASSTGVASVLSDEHWNATSRRLGAGRSTAGRRLKKSAPRKAHHRLRRRERIERTSTSGADLGAARTDSGPAVPLHLEGALGRGRDHLVELLLPTLSPHHSWRGSRRFPQPSAASLAGQALGGVGRTAGASRTRRQGVHRRAPGPARRRAIAGLRTRTQSGRVHLGLLEASRTAQLLSSRFHPAPLSCPPRLGPHASSSHPGDGILGAGPAVSFVTILCRTQ